MAINTSDDGSPSNRIAAAYRRLSKSAGNLNSASDALGKAIASADEQLHALNLGIAAWVVIAGDSDDDTETYWRKSLGYDKVGGKWGIALKDDHGHFDDPGGLSFGCWLFNDAPRSLRLEALPKLPELFEELVKQTDNTTATIETATEEAQQLADILKQLAPPPARKATR
jgi:hypothetical protein